MSNCSCVDLVKDKVNCTAEFFRVFCLVGFGVLVFLNFFFTRFHLF